MGNYATSKVYVTLNATKPMLQTITVKVKASAQSSTGETLKDEVVRETRVYHLGFPEHRSVSGLIGPGHE